ncbi:unnamed protein product [Spirodela intermedia]|uniref:Uncharacterized protein n=1 Tax=Spirodela intermedia TaxID=51605 RepID=A0A7I8J7G7_SPIIN|nr:unnamed protein product [Spirodela intermedia]CAA6665675.1 unnamed protein product [Spirodela intermedia]
MGIFHQDAVIEEFEALTNNVGKVQRETLKMILEENSEAEYLQKLQGLRSLVSHPDLESYIRRIAAGESSPILTGKPITSITYTSGTTQGRPKYVPFNDFLIQNTMQAFRTSFAFRNKWKSLQFIYGSQEVRTSGGIVAFNGTTNIFRSEQFKRTMRDTQSQTCSPYEVIFGRSFEQSLYCHLLCGLLSYQEVQFVSSSFAHCIVQAFRTFELIWEELCANIRDGVLSSKITDPSMKAAIYTKCKGLSNWFGLIPALWPNAKYVYGVMTGGEKPAVEAEPIGLEEIELGKEYEVIITNFAGLYRYRLGDVVRVGGFHNSTPELQFVCRRGLVLNVNVDKNTERDLQLAVQEASKLAAAEKLEVVDFSSCVDRSAEPGHYVIFWELCGEARESVLRSCADCLDRSFLDAGYKCSRKAKGIAPLELRIVRPGTFRKVLKHYTNQGAAMSQFKNPRFVGATNAAVLRILCDGVVQSFSSTAYD